MKSSVFTLESFDGYPLTIKLSTPNKSQVGKLIIFVQGTGPNTYDNHRKIEEVEFNYFDLFAKEFCKRDIAFCRWSTRGCSISENSPMYVNIDDEKYKSYLPSTSVSDIEFVVNYLKNQEQFKNTKIILFGFSEGSQIAPLVALNGKANIHGLLLAGYANENLRTTLEWQLSGGSSMVNMCKWFDYENKGYITKANFEEDRYQLRQTYLGDITFEDYDLDYNGIIEQKDFEIMLREYKNQVFNAINSDDDEWLKNNYEVRITSAWCKEHFKLSPAKEILVKLNIPIHIFHGKDDASIPVQDVLDIDKTFKKLKKNNLHVNIFENHDHDLNYLLYPMKAIISEGLQSIFETAAII
ncbi:hypothetical protein P8V03_09805 [Clostridium sp. A1-XYC3]|uniref:EF-hand domain-containing protein n=1 Tax=Clostridium tanneri TaxID=3037988 RepID=A0ABU4JTG6_9CLOT|nr:hypothetical protein [Clostridium sp. A1-XYC3]MDW8801448.1 hypothetical protein [Clostridium sp. A1-XYC3]